MLTEAKTARRPSSIIVLVALLSSVSACGTKAAVGVRGSRPIESRAHSVTTLADECLTIENVKALEHAPRSPYPGSIAGSDVGVLRLATLWPPGKQLRDAIRAARGTRHAGQRYWDPDIGFEADRASEGISAGFLWCAVCAVSAVLFRDEIAAAEVSCRWYVHPKRLECVTDRYRAVLAELGLRTDGELFFAQLDFPDVLSGMNRARLVAMGESANYDLAPSSTMPARLSAAEQYLSQPLAQLSVGCNESPPGFEEAKQLVDAGETAALKRILRGPNPEGRGYAAIGLSKLGALSADDLRVIERLKDTSTVATQGGSMVTINAAREFYGELSQLHHIFESQ